MSETDVSTDEVQLMPLESWRRIMQSRVGLLYVWMMFTLMVFTIASIVLWASTLYQLQRRTATLEAVIHTLEDGRKADHVAFQDTIDGIYRTIYTPLDTPEPISNRKPSSIELWQVNRDKELRERLSRLERWRLSFEDGKR